LAGAPLGGPPKGGHQQSPNSTQKVCMAKHKKIFKKFYIHKPTNQSAFGRLKNGCKPTDHIMRRKIIDKIIIKSKKINKRLSDLLARRGRKSPGELTPAAFL